MNWDYQYQYTPYIWPMVASVVFLGALGAYAWQHRSRPGAVFLAWTALLIGLWALGNVLEISTPDFATRVFWLKVQMVLSLFAPVAELCFVLEYAGLGKWLTRRNLAVLFAPAVAITPVYFVDVSLLWTPILVDGDVRRQLTPLALVPNLYGMAVLLLSLAAVAALFVRSPLHRKPAAFLLIGHLGPLLAVPLDALNVVSVGPLDIAVLGCDFAFAMYAIALFRFALFDVVPVARASVIEHMADAMVVLDAAGRVAELNPAALKLFGAKRSRTLGQDGAEVLGTLPALAEVARDGTPKQAEFSIGVPPDQRWHQVKSTPLIDQRGFHLGSLIVLHDITALKQAQERLLQQERALAALHEREQLARELHDSVGQVLGYVSLQADAACKLLADGKANLATDQLERLASIARDAHADVREFILALRSAPTEQRAFFPALRRYLDGFTQNYGVVAELALSDGLDQAAFAPEAQAQLFRIIQEALANARKHGGARSAKVTFVRQGNLAHVVVQDDGEGFDPGAVEGGFGLRFMHERAAEIGGAVAVDSAPGRGTRIVVEVPLSLAQVD
ncbi:MAG: sensor histidine kinase [Chloroflexota bacterium]